MYAWLDLRNRKAAGEHVNERDLKKHKYDVFRLLQIVREETVVITTGMVTEAVNEFLQVIPEEALPLAQLGIDLEADYAVNLLKMMYIDR